MIIYNCLKKIAENLGNHDFFIYKKDKNRNYIKNSDLSRFNDLINGKANNCTSLSDFLIQSAASMLEYGNAYIYIDDSLNNIQLILLNPQLIVVAKDSTNIINPEYYYYYNGMIVPNENIIHIKNWDTDLNNPVLGVPVKVKLAKTLENIGLADNVINNLYKNNMYQKSVVEVTDTANFSDVEKAKEKFIEAQKEVNSDTNSIFLPIGYKIQPLNINFTDSQFLEVNKEIKEEVKNAFNITTGVQYTSLEQEQQDFYLNTMKIIVKQFVQAFNNKLLSKTEKNLYRVSLEMNFFDNLTAEQRINFLKTGVMYAILTSNEARAYLHLPKNEYGNDLMCNNFSLLKYQDIKQGLSVQELQQRIKDLENNNKNEVKNND